MAQQTHANENPSAAWDDLPFDSGRDAQRMDIGARAQSRPKGNHGLATRFGLHARKRVVVACVAVMLALAAISVMRFTRAESGFQLSRALSVSDGGFDATVPDDVSGAEAPPIDEPAVKEVVIDVDGAVMRPGVYRLALPSPRVSDAVDAAGGLSEDADTSTVNLAEPLSDGVKVYIHRQGDAASSNVSAAGSAVVSAQPSDAPGLININTATADELTVLPGVGEATAQAIITERERNGAFSTTDELMRVSGIGEKRYAKIKELICV